MSGNGTQNIFVTGIIEFLGTTYLNELKETKETVSEGFGVNAALANNPVSKNHYRGHGK